ncbi:hypothetical protein O181_065332 [Austropuccinia psidii MF-1]|uniref:Reverse transcriptase domain-containing protein n=1 Tax=Austropuccinia psidii MF-1 TaxID=1389203 RepID=A0A9Q3EX87_9BASI|nr:hypothetical protein [Austropuccinia psidii MF-1]
MDSPKRENLILGYDLLYHFDPIIDCKSRLVTYDSTHKNSSGINSSTSNDLATTISTVALMKDVVEDVAISSLHLFQRDMDLPLLSVHASLKQQWDEEEQEEIETVLKVVPPAHHKCIDVFSKVKAEKLPPHQACDNQIKLEGPLPLASMIYSLSNQESETLRAYISDNVAKSTIRKNRYPVPPMNQLLTVFKGSTILSKIDLCGAYNLPRIKKGYEHLTAFRTKYGSYEYLVITFGLTNAPPSFQNPVNNIFADFMDIFVVVYLDRIMVSSSSEELHVKHVASVLQRLRDNNLFSKASKCVFHSPSLDYLGYVVSSDLLNMYSSRVQQILDWPQPK